MSAFDALFSNVVELDSKLASMQAAGRIDKEIDNVLDKIISFVAQREQSCSHRGDTPKTFAIYHSWRNLRLIFSKMRTRFANAQLINGNHLIVDQAREIVPKILQILPSLIAMEIEPSEKEIEQISQRTRELRASARQVDMVPPPSEELKEIDRTKLMTMLDSLLSRVETLGET